MKHLKRFNEELKPQTYKNAGRKLINKGHIKRGINLSSYGHEIDNDLIGFWVGDDSSKKSFLMPLEFEFSSLRYRVDHDSKSWEYPSNNEYYREKREKELYKMVELYKNGTDDLYIDIQLYFKISPRQAELFKDLLRKNDYGKSGVTDQYLIRAISNESEIPLITYRLGISDSIYWEDDDGNKGELKDEDFYEFFSNGFYPNLIKRSDNGIISEYRSGSSVVHKIIGIPCSRKEAIKFKKIVIPKLAESLGPLINELFSEHIQGKPEDFEKTMTAITDQKINDLYTDDLPSGDIAIFNKQFTKR